MDIVRAPILRWTFGNNSSSNGLNSLMHSVALATELYGPHFRYFLLCNSSDPDKIDIVRRICAKHGVGLRMQSWSDMPFRHAMPPNKSSDMENHEHFSGSIWKICPPRLDMACHEIVLDNDVLLFKRVPEIDEFLKSDRALISCDVGGTFFGRYAHLHNDNSPYYNTGILGYPPGWDLASTLVELWDDYPLENLSYADEQGLLSAAVATMNPILVKPTRVAIAHPRGFSPENFGRGGDGYSYRKDFARVLKRFCGIHFVGLNRSEDHIGWRLFLNQAHVKQF